MSALIGLFGRSGRRYRSGVAVIVPILTGIAFVLINGFIREPARQRFNVVFVGGAGAAYLSSCAFGPWELLFTAAMTVCAYLGLKSYRWIGVAWLLHTGWDVLHAVVRRDLLPFAPHSSTGCAICDPVIALWCFGGGPSIPELIRDRRARRTSTSSTAV